MYTLLGDDVLQTFLGNSIAVLADRIQGVHQPTGRLNKPPGSWGFKKVGYWVLDAETYD